MVGKSSFYHLSFPGKNLRKKPGKMLSVILEKSREKEEKLVDKI